MKSKLLVILLFVSSVIAAQKFEDFGIWMGGDFSKKINKHFSLNGSLSLRTDENTSHINQFYYQLGGEYKIKKNFKTSLGYRNRYNFSYVENDITNRLIWDMTYKLKLNKFAFQFRNRLQFDKEVLGDVKSYDRLRIKAQYELEKDLTGFVYYEAFFKLTDYTPNRYNAYRVGIGMEYKVNKDFSIGVAYMRSTSLDKKVPEIFNCIDIGVEFEF